MTVDACTMPTTGWYVINLDRSPDRLARIRAEFDALGIAAERVPAVDGACLVLPQPGIDHALYRRTHGRDLAANHHQDAVELRHLRRSPALDVTHFIGWPAFVGEGRAELRSMMDSEAVPI